MRCATRVLADVSGSTPEEDSECEAQVVHRSYGYFGRGKLNVRSSCCAYGRNVGKIFAGG